MKQRVIIALGLLLFVRCTTPEEKVLDFSDIAPTAERDYTDDVTIEEGDSTTWVKQRFVSNGIDLNTISYVTKSNFPDRFGPNSSEKYALYRASDTIHYYKWRYIDSVKTYNAFYNWLDCFGDKCESYFVGGNKNMQRNAFKMMVTDTVLIFVESTDQLNFNEWDAYHDSLGFAPTWKYILEQKRRGPVKWFTFEEEEKIKLAL